MSASQDGYLAATLASAFSLTHRQDEPWSMRQLSQLKQKHCCNLSVGVALNVRFTTNRMCMKNNTIYMWREQEIQKWSEHVISIVACCHTMKLCAHAVQDFWLQQHHH